MDAPVLSTEADNLARMAKYKQQWDYWNKSSRNIGTLSIPGIHEPVLQMWRGEGVLKGYICVGGPRRTAINDLVSAIQKYIKTKNQQHSFSSLIQSPPGWGKSFLARSLAEYFDLEYVEFSIAQMCDNRDFMDCFASIASIQSRTQKQTLVFIDEVNAEIEGHTVMGALLSPLWEGTFVKDRQSYRLKPGVWIFASTSPLDELAKVNKGTDFISRLNGPVIGLDSPGYWTKAISNVKEILNEKREDFETPLRTKIYEDSAYKFFQSYDKKNIPPDEHKTEQVYLMLSLLNKRWGPINRVEKRVLELFHDLLPINGYRSLDIFTDCFEGIERGEVHAENVPDLNRYESLYRQIVIPEWWVNNLRTSADMVTIQNRYS